MAISAEIALALPESGSPHRQVGEKPAGARRGFDQAPQEMLHRIRDLTIIVRKRKLKPEKGRRKDLRKIDSLILDLVSTMGHKN